MKSQLSDNAPDRHPDPTYMLGDFFTIKRGIETGDNDFFLLDPRAILARDLPMEFMRPILPGPSHLIDQEIVADPEGYPIVEERLFLLDCPLPEQEIRRDYPTLWAYLEEGKERGVHQRYISRHRSPWYLQERRPPAPFLCAYTGRGDRNGTAAEGAPFRFILNNSRAIAPNVYLMMYPRPALAERIGREYHERYMLWSALNEIDVRAVRRRAVIYGDDAGGKLEPMELASVPADLVVRLYPDLRPDSEAQLPLFDEAPEHRSDDAADDIPDDLSRDAA